MVAPARAAVSINCVASSFRHPKWAVGSSESVFKHIFRINLKNKRILLEYVLFFLKLNKRYCGF